MIKTFKYALLPSKAQRKKIDRLLRICTYAYNHLIGMIREDREKNKGLPKEEQIWRVNKKTMYSILAESKKDCKVMNCTAEDMLFPYAQSFNGVTKQVEQAEKAYHENWKAYNQAKKKGLPAELPEDLGFRSARNESSVAYPTVSGAVAKIAEVLMSSATGKPRISLPLGGGKRIEGVRVAYHRPLPSKPSGIRIKRTATGKYFIYLTCEVVAPISRISPIERVGIDPGLKCLAAFSSPVPLRTPVEMESPQIVKNPRFYETLQKRREIIAQRFSTYQIRVANELLAREGVPPAEKPDSKILKGLKKKLISGYVAARDAVNAGDLSKREDITFFRSRLRKMNKLRLAKARVEEQVVNSRHNFFHQFALQMVRNVQTVVVEKLKVKELQTQDLSGMDVNSVEYRKQRNAARSIGKSGLASMLTILEAKYNEYGKSYIAVEARGTTRTCHACGAVKEKTLDQRTHSCEVCGAELDRDINAALNILARGSQEEFIVKKKAPKKTNLGYNGKKKKEGNLANEDVKKVAS